VESLYRLEAVVLLLGAVLVLMAVARRILIPYPIFLVLGGLILGFVPGVPAVRPSPRSSS
jgi:CPA1 family monovalent cation:H+ antiporter